MSAALPLPPDMPFAEAAGEALGRRADELAAARGVEQARLAARRARAALELFAPCFPRRAHREALRDVERLLAALAGCAEARARVAAVARLEASMGDTARPGLAHARARLDAERAAADAAVDDALRHAGESGLRERLAQLADEARA